MQKSSKNNYDCIVIGGGAAGMMAALTAAEYGREVLIIERNGVCGKKLAITGKGRCNVTNNCSRDEFMANIPTNPRFLFSAYSKFTTEACMDFFEGLGVPLKTERGNRVFPVSDRAEDIVRALENACSERGVQLAEDMAKSLIISDGSITGVNCVSGKFAAESVVIATGGMSYPKTGSDGNGYTLAKQAGHKIIPIKPSLVPLVSEESCCAEMMGLSLKNVTLTLFDLKKNKQLFSELGEMLFTHFGVSGPLVLSASSHIPAMEKGRWGMKIDMKPALDEKKLDERILRDFGAIPNRIFANSLSALLPQKMIPVIVRLSGINPDKQVNAVTKQERAKLVSLLKAFPVTVAGFRPVSEAIVTGGGVCTSEISPQTMESKLVKGLFFAGEVIDVDGYTGGFNLQIAFSTGRVCGQNI